MIRLISIVLLGAFAACGPIAPNVAADRCEARAQAAQGPTGGVTFGVNSETGNFASANIGVSTDFLRGDDPAIVYERCVIELTGALPVRPPVLRDR